MLSNKTQSPWLMMDAANVIFSEAKARVFVGEIKSQQEPVASEPVADEDGIDADEEEAAFGTNFHPSSRFRDRLWWLPPGIEPTLEELPKWHLLREVLDEIEEHIHWSNTDLTRNNTVLIMVETERSCLQIREFLSTMRTSVLGRREQQQQQQRNRPGRRLMERQLKEYFQWKYNLGTMSSNLRNPLFASTAPQQQQSNGRNSNYESEALKRKEIWEGGRAPAHKRRRQRGGAVLGGASSRRNTGNAPENLEAEASDVAQL